MLSVRNALSTPFGGRPGRGLRIVADLLERADGSFALRPSADAVVAEAVVPVAERVGRAGRSESPEQGV